ncbi:hypothetical protein [Microcoleus vaginatus]|uniref:hypothetical protein n=1 Tax=Microcoleus vaginatus TaxID=119532 RepID=UPI001F6191AD
MNRQDACSTRQFTLCGTGIWPVLENGARCEFNVTLASDRNTQYPILQNYLRAIAL